MIVIKDNVRSVKYFSTLRTVTVSKADMILELIISTKLISTM